MSVDAMGEPQSKSQNESWNGKELADWRKIKRTELLKLRAGIPAEQYDTASRLILDNAAGVLRSVSPGVAGFYWPIRGEINVIPLMESFVEGGGSAGLPAIVAKAQPLEFRLWRPGDPMARGVFDIPYPAEARIVHPEVLVVPLVGFDDEGYRLGYGGGYYDRTLSSLAPRPLTIGIGFASTRLETIHPQPYDIPMDYIVTELEVRRVNPTA
jgi:5-formyltetrahydrofolate cyclo-ligase